MAWKVADVLGAPRNGTETARIEVRRGFTASVAATISAFSNEPDLGGGWLVFGASVGAGGIEVVGAKKVDRLRADLLALCEQGFSVPVQPEIRDEVLNGKRLVVAFIPEAPATEKPVYIRGRGHSGGSFRRRGSDDKKCTPEDHRLLGERFRDGLIAPSATAEVRWEPMPSSLCGRDSGYVIVMAEGEMIRKTDTTLPEVVVKDCADLVVDLAEALDLGRGCRVARVVGKRFCAVEHGRSRMTRPAARLLAAFILDGRRKRTLTEVWEVLWSRAQQLRGRTSLDDHEGSGDPTKYMLQLLSGIRKSARPDVIDAPPGGLGGKVYSLRADLKACVVLPEHVWRQLVRPKPRQAPPDDSGAT